MQRAFIIRPFGRKTDQTGREIDFDHIQAVLIEPALRAVGFGSVTTGEIIDAGNFRDDMLALLLEADVGIFDITIHNANVFYQLGIRHALRKKRSVLIRGEPAADTPLFDIVTDNYLPYRLNEPEEAVSTLTDKLIAALVSERTDSPIFRLRPNLPEVKAAAGTPLAVQEVQMSGTQPTPADARRVFIVHGHDEAARETVARLVERAGLIAVILREQPNQGRTIIEKFESHSEKASFAIVLLTPDDEGKPRGAAPKALRPRARQNVVAELFFFIGTLGRAKVCALVKDDVELPSDFAGVVYQPMDAGGAWKFELVREMQAAGLPIDLNKVFGQ